MSPRKVEDAGFLELTIPDMIKKEHRFCGLQNILR